MSALVYFVVARDVRIQGKNLSCQVQKNNQPPDKIANVNLSCLQGN